MQNIAFQWERCRAGYEVVPPKKCEPSEQLKRTTKEAVAAGRMTQGHADAVLKAASAGSAVLRPKSRDFEKIAPIKHHAALFRQFAALSTQRDFVEFAHDFGLLTHEREDEAIATWHVERENMRIAVASWEADETGGLENLFNDRRWATLAIRFRDGAMALEPRNLRDAMWVQLAVSLTKREKHKACVWCKTWFPYGSGTGRRETALYCSPKCQKAHAYQKTKGEG